jgi:transposase
MKAYSLDLRTRIVEAVDRHVGSQGEVAALFGVSRSLVKKLLRQRREMGSVAPKPPGGGHTPKVTGKQGEAVRTSILDVKNAASLAEVQTSVARRWKVGLSQATVSRLVARLGLPRKKPSVASDRDEAQRVAFRAVVAPLDQKRFIVVAETSINIARTRSYARAPRGQRAYGAVPRNDGPNLSVSGALGLQGMGAALSVEGAGDPDVFDGCVRRVLVPALTPGDVVRLDNLNVPHASCSEQAVLAAQGQVMFLPSYSPDCSPIEPWWSKRKTGLRAAAARTRPRLEAALKSAFHTIRREDLRGWFTHCGYLVPSK